MHHLLDVRTRRIAQSQHSRVAEITYVLMIGHAESGVAVNDENWSTARHRAMSTCIEGRPVKPIRLVVALVPALVVALAGCAQRSVGSAGPKIEPPRQGTATPEPGPGAPYRRPVTPDDPSQRWTVPCYPPDVPMSDAADNPRFGDYVYVEGLPEAIEKVPPVYPQNARGRDGDRIVMVQALVRRDGTVGEVCIVRSIPALDSAAAMCVKHWRFRPANAAGNPVAVWVGVPVKFEAP